MACLMEDDVEPGMLERRKAMMTACGQASPAELHALVEALAPGLEVADLRRPEAGLVMVRGRMGGDGRPFNLGEASVSRAAVELGSGTRGFAYQLGRDKAKARDSAILDALWQEEATRAGVEEGLAPVAARQAQDDATRARQTAATRVNFFTMVRGDN